MIRGQSKGGVWKTFEGGGESDCTSKMGKWRHIAQEITLRNREGDE